MLGRRASLFISNESKIYRRVTIKNPDHYLIIPGVYLSFEAPSRICLYPPG